MAKIALDFDFTARPEILRLCEELDDPNAIFYVIRLWLWASRYLPEGDLTQLRPKSIAVVSGWAGDPDVFMQALLDTFLIYVTENGFVYLQVYQDYVTDDKVEEQESELIPRFSDQRKAILRADRDRVCTYCERSTAEGGGTHIDHVIPRSRGGTNRLANLVIACRECNVRKGNRTPEEAGMKIKRARSWS